MWFSQDHSCIRATDVIIYTTSGEAIFSDEAVSEEARAQNNQLKIKLEAIVEKNRADAVLGSNLGLRSSRTDFWDISFFVVPLTPPQVQEVQQMANVEIIVPNNAANVDGPTSANLAEQPVNAAPRRKRRKLEKRDDRLYRDEAAWEDLRFVSTPGQVELSERFSYYKNDDSYYENGAQRVTIILIGGGVRRDHDEFRSGGRNLISMYMNGMDADILQDDYTGVGTCLASKLVSPSYGVGKDMEMIIAKVAGTIGSLLNMLENIIWFFKGLKKEGRQIKGYYVLTMGSHWPDPKDYSSTRLQRIIRLLLVRYEVVVVVAAGEDRTRSFAPIDEIPGIFSTRAGTRDLITVGAVTSDGRVCPWSKGGDALSILAPGYVLCASYKGPNENQLDLGTNVATIQTASLAGYYLSRRQIGYLIRQDPAGVPHAAKAWIKTNSQERIMGNRVIWNMLGDHLT